jgi:hypothetical protein
MNSEALTKEYLKNTWNIELSDIETSMPKKGDAQMQAIVGLKELGFYYTQIAKLLKTNPSFIRRHYVIYKVEVEKKKREEKEVKARKSKKHFYDQINRINKFLKIEHLNK